MSHFSSPAAGDQAETLVGLEEGCLWPGMLRARSLPGTWETKHHLNKEFRPPSPGHLHRARPCSETSLEQGAALAGAALMPRLGDSPGHMGLWGTVGCSGAPQGRMMQGCPCAHPDLVPSCVPLKTPPGRPQVLLKGLPEVLATCPRRQQTTPKQSKMLRSLGVGMPAQCWGFGE